MGGYDLPKTAGTAEGILEDRLTRDLRRRPDRKLVKEDTPLLFGALHFFVVGAGPVDFRMTRWVGSISSRTSR